MMLRRHKATTTTVPTETPVATSAMPTSSPIDQESQDLDELQGTIASRAYALYEERGYRHGCDLQDWLDAEREIVSRQPPT
ncbi:MAG: DUF2934 domain-containing protein [Nitrospira sp.]|nr:DUF2934 domain-containing protein [Nitrospira sp.]